MKCTVEGSMHGLPATFALPKPVAQLGLMSAAVFSGAFRLLMSGRSGPPWPSPLRSTPFAIVYGKPVDQCEIVDSVQPPSSDPISPRVGARGVHSTEMAPTCRRSKSELP